LEDFGAEVEINSAWKRVRKNIKMSAKDILGFYELKKHKPWFEKDIHMFFWKNILIQIGIMMKYIK
jgi:hypothetical protein